MANYTPITDFAAKDALLVGDPNKIIKGTEFTAEFNAINTAVASKADSSSANAFTAGATSVTTLSTTGNVTLGDASTDTVTVNGYMGVGGAANPSHAITILSNALTGASQRALSMAPVYTSAATANGTTLASIPSTAAASFTMTALQGFRAFDATKGAGSTITNQHGVQIDDQTQGTNNYGLTSLVSSGTNKWNIYASGTAANYFAGNVGIGTSAPTTRLQIGDGTVDANNALKFGKTVTASQSTLPYISQVSEQSAGVTNDLMIFAGGTGGGRVIVNSNDFVVKTGGGTTPSGTERMRIDSSGNLGLGVTPSAWGAIWKTYESTNGALASTSTSIRLFNNNYHNGTNYIYSTTAATGRYEIVSGVHAWFGSDSGTAGNTLTNNTQLLALQKGFSVPLEGATVKAGTGITFPATQSASSDANTLDDYEEGTFTPTIVGTGTAGAGTYSEQAGQYTKIGDKVWFNIRLTWSAHTGTGDIVVGGLPFTTNSSGNFRVGALSISAQNLTLTTATHKLIAYLAASSSQITLAQADFSAGWAAVALDTSASIFINGSYKV